MTDIQDGCGCAGKDAEIADLKALLSTTSSALKAEREAKEKAERRRDENWALLQKALGVVGYEKDAFWNVCSQRDHLADIVNEQWVNAAHTEALLEDAERYFRARSEESQGCGGYPEAEAARLAEQDTWGYAADWVRDRVGRGGR